MKIKFLFTVIQSEGLRPLVTKYVKLILQNDIFGRLKNLILILKDRPRDQELQNC